MHVITARCSCPLEWEKHRWSLQIEQTHIVPSLLLINIGIWIHLHHKLTGWTHWELRAQSSSFKNPQLWWTSTCSPGWTGMRTIRKCSGYNISKQRWEKLIKSRELCHTEDTPCKWAFPCPLPTIHQWNELQLLKLILIGYQMWGCSFKGSCLTGTCPGTYQQHQTSCDTFWN